MAGFFSNHFGSGKYKDPAATCKLSRGIVHVEVLASKAGTVAPTKAVSGVTATVTGPDNPNPGATAGNGRKSFGPLHLGNYTASIAFPNPLDEKYDIVNNPPAPQTLNLAAGAVTLFTFRVNWHWIEFQVRDSAGRASANVEFRLWYRTPNGLLFNQTEEGKLPANGNLVREEIRRGRYKLRFPTLTNPAWSTPTLEIGTAIQLTADATGFEIGDAGEFQILDAFDQSKPIHTIPATMAAGGGGVQLQANWTPLEAMFKKLEQSQVVFLAKAATAKVMSPRRTLLKTETLDLVHADDTPINTRITLHFSGGTSWTAANLPGGTEQAKIPWKEEVIRIEMPNLHDSRVKMESEGMPEKLLAFQ